MHDILYAETGRHPISIAVQKSDILCWLKVVHCEKKRLINIIYCKMKKKSVVGMLCKGHIMCNSLVNAGFIKELKENHVSKTYLRRNISCTLRNTFAKNETHLPYTSGRKGKVDSA